MDFALSEEQQLFAKNLREFAKKELFPNYARWDQEGRFPREMWRTFAKYGLTGLGIPAAYGGSQTDCVTTGIAFYEIARADINSCLIMLVSTLEGEIIGGVGAEPIKEEWLPALASGEKVMAVALTEPSGGSDAAALKTRAVKKGDCYVLNGEKSSISFTAEADAVIVFAKTNVEAGARGVSAFLVPTELPGVSRQYYEDLGCRGIRRGSFFFEDAEIPAINLLGQEGMGFRQIMHEFDYSRTMLGLMCLGAAEVTLEETMEYVKGRPAFGRPLAKFEGVSFPIAEAATYLEAIRWLCFRALWLRDQGVPHAKEAAMVKWLAPKVCTEIVHKCLLLHGHYGYTREYPVEQRLRDVMAYEIGDGTAEVQKIIIARELMGREFLPY